MIDSIEEKILNLIDQNRGSIIDFARDIYTHGELGYKEYRTSQKFEELVRSKGLQMENGLAITGVKAYLKPERQDVSVALIGELDALLIPTHAHANPENGAAHCCGHHAQLAGVAGALYALTDPEVAAALDGQVVFYAVPSEEYGEVEFKNKLIEEGKIKYGGGKSELIRIGAFDDVDISVVHHTSTEGITVGSGTSNGFVSKVIKYNGREAHAAGAPNKGINALNAASLGLSALAYQRETFRDEDSVRVHPIITKGGNLVNIIPNEVVIETLVRAKTFEAIADADKKTDRAFKAGADAVGAGYEIKTVPGYLPCLAAEAHPALYEAAQMAAPDVKLKKAETTRHGAASTDVGDLQHIMPVLKFTTSGITGIMHSDTFEVTDEELAYITTAKMFALAAYNLLKNGAEEARRLVSEYEPVYTKEEYIKVMDGMIRTERKATDSDDEYKNKGGFIL